MNRAQDFRLCRPHVPQEARLVFTHGFTSDPRSTAFFARIPAAIITEGFEVFVQLVIAAMTTEPWPSSYFLPLSVTATGDTGFACLEIIDGSACWNASFDF